MQTGTRVVCVDTLHPTQYAEVIPVVGHLYTLRTVNTYSFGTYVRLVEISNNKNTYRSGFSIVFDECEFDAGCFRPVTTLEADLHRIESEGCPVEQEEPVLT